MIVCNNGADLIWGEIDLEKPLNDLLEEAIQDLLKKYRKTPPKPSK